jgi:hypothetical protein
MLVSMRSMRAFLAAFRALTILVATQSGLAAAKGLDDPNLSADQARVIFVSAG